MSVALRLEDEIDISRGDMIVRTESLPHVGRTFDAHLVWMSERPLDTEKTYILKHTTQTVRCQVVRVGWKLDMDELEHVPATELELNDIARVSVTCHRALYYDGYDDNRTTGAFIVIDSLTNDTVAAGMVIDEAPAEQGLDEALREIRAGSAIQPKTQVSPRERRERMGQSGATVWLTGLPGSGRWPLAYALERRLFDLGRTATVIDPTGEDLRSMISAAKACSDAGLVTICAFPSFARDAREEVRARLGAARFIEVYVNTAEVVCRERRPDASFEGFEAPERPAVTVSLDRLRLERAVNVIVEGGSSGRASSSRRASERR